MVTMATGVSIVPIQCRATSERSCKLQLGPSSINNNKLKNIKMAISDAKWKDTPLKMFGCGNQIFGGINQIIL
jgi:hypothetical protein